MRQIATLPDGNQAQTLADYLLTLNIKTQLAQETDGWAVWVCDEDQVPRARQELTAFLIAPTDTRYHAAQRIANNLRQKEDREEEEYRQRQDALRDKMTNPPRAHRRVTVSLIAASILVALLTDFGQSPNVERQFTITLFATEEHPRTLTLPQQLATGEVWRLITPIFLHYGLPHLLFNMIMLAPFGAQIEMSRGPWKLLGLVLVIGVLSNLGQYYLGGLSLDRRPGELHWSFHPNPRFGGMSGVLYGLFGYTWMKTRFEPEMGLFVTSNQVVVMIAWFFLCMTGAVGDIANVAHGVGLFLGMVIGIAPSLWRRGH